MNVVFLIENDRLFHPDFLANFLKHLPRNRHRLLVGIVTTLNPAAKGLNRFDYLRKKMRLLGGFPGWLKVLVLFLRRPYWSVQSVCRRFDIECFSLEDINGAEVFQQIRAFQPDILFSFQGQIIEKRLLELPRFGCINRHAGLLPKYRGVWPVFWALLNGEKECGISFHLMTEKIDDGPILLQEKIPVQDNDTVLSIYERLFSLMPAMILKILQDCEEGRLTKTDNPSSRSTYFGFPEREHVRALRDIAHRRVI